VRAGVASSPRTDTLQYKKLGDSDLVISEITLGTVRVLGILRELVHKFGIGLSLRCVRSWSVNLELELGCR
jgi:hypothetical protein